MTKKPSSLVSSSINPKEAIGSIHSTVSGPSSAELDKTQIPMLEEESQRQLADKLSATQDLAKSIPHNPIKTAEHGLKQGHNPQAGTPHEPESSAVTGSTLSEHVSSTKVGSGQVAFGINATNAPLDQVRADATAQPLTTNQGVPISDNQNSLKAGLRGPTLMEDFILREKLTHFDHERIPERVVHARGSAAHGYFECYEPLTDITRAIPFSEAGKKTPVFVRFSTVAGERGSIDTARDVRGFAVKFYTEEGNWDLVGNNIPVFFIQDAMKFPDLVHALKPEPHHGMPQAASAHDTFWDFVSLMPESTHMLLWVMSDRAIPRSYRMMQGFGVHTFRLVNAAGESVFCKFHWTPKAGAHSLVWDEAVKIAGADPDFHRRDLWEAIEGGAYPEYELGLQLFTEEQAAKFPFDVLDPTKIVPEELVPVRPVGRMVLNRNPDNFFAETEQVAFCTAHLIPGLDFTNDPLLQGRIHSYVDTQLIRLGGPNFHEIPINASIRSVSNNQRDGLHRQTINRGRVAYEPNSLGGGCPFQAGMKGFISFPEPVVEDKVRGKPELFADHYSQATLFWNSQTETEKKHIIAAFRFELTRVQTPAIRERVVAALANVADELAEGVAAGLGIAAPAPLPTLLPKEKIARYSRSSPELSLFHFPGEPSLVTRKIAVIVADRIDATSLRAVYEKLAQLGAQPRFIGPQLGTVVTTVGDPIHIEISFESAPSALWDGVVIPDGPDALNTLMVMGQVKEFIRDQYRHCKPILVLGSGSQLIDSIGIPRALPDGKPDEALVITGDLQTSALENTIELFKNQLIGHRYYARETDPPRI